MSGEEMSFALAMEIYYIGLFVHKKNNIAVQKGPLAATKAVQVGEMQNDGGFEGIKLDLYSPGGRWCRQEHAPGFPDLRHRRDR